jgi:hypothetical protein
MRGGFAFNSSLPDNEQHYLSIVRKLKYFIAFAYWTEKRTQNPSFASY